jgi:hypothetical protein
VGWAHFRGRDASGKRGNTAATARFGQGQKARGQSIAQLAAEKTKLLDRMDEDFDESLKDYLPVAN